MLRKNVFNLSEVTSPVCFGTLIARASSLWIEHALMKYFTKVKMVFNVIVASIWCHCDIKTTSMCHIPQLPMHWTCTGMTQLRLQIQLCSYVAPFSCTVHIPSKICWLIAVLMYMMQCRSIALTVKISRDFDLRLSPKRLQTMLRCHKFDCTHCFDC